MAARLVVVSNRVPLGSNAVRAQDSAGHPGAAPNASAGVLWFGWSGRLGADNTVHRLTCWRTGGAVNFVAMDLTEAQFDGYLNGFANGTLWPLFHDMPEHVRFHPDDLAHYQSVNATFAARLVPLLRPDDRIWIQDYQLIPMAGELRKAGVTNPIGLFLHVPFPAPQGLLAWPWHRKLAQDMAAYDLVGFQTWRDEANFEKFMRAASTRFAIGSRNVGPRAVPATGVFPVGINTRLFMATAAAPDLAERAARLGHCLNDRHVILSTDRLDYTKGLIERLRAYESLLSESQEYRCTTSMVTVTAPSRTLVPGYLELRMEQQAFVERINARFMSHGWMPVLDIYAKLPQRSLAALSRMARVALATPLRDGVNIAAKEYVAAQNPRDPGVLILSRHAGAAELLTEALLVDPRDEAQMTAALRTALRMPLEERQERWRRMIVKLLHHDAIQWHQEYLEALVRAHHQASRPMGAVGERPRLRPRPPRLPSLRMAAGRRTGTAGRRASALRPGLA